MTGKTNDQYIHDALQSIKTPLEKFVVKKIETKTRDIKNFLTGKIRNLRVRGGLIDWDNASLLRTMDVFWDDIFKLELGDFGRVYINETIQVRNKSAHDGIFTMKQTARAIDSMALLMQAIKEDKVEEELNKVKDTINYYIDKNKKNSLRRTLQHQQLDLKSGLKPWREIVEPYAEIAQGNFNRAGFAANLADVLNNEAGEQYQNPKEFFSRTYLTSGLSTLLKNASKQLSGLGNNPIFQLKTNFGGGKTHSLLALYHLAGSTKATELNGVSELLKDIDLPKNIKRAVFVGTDINPLNMSIGGFKINTIWGRIFYEIGGETGFNIIKDNDNEGINPGADKISELLSQFSPCLILIDELVVFLKNIYDKTNPICGSFDNNLSFIQSLSEAVSRTKNSLLVASLPESETEIGGESGQKVFEKLSKVFGRMDATWSAASQVESYEIVKRRIFKPILGDKLLLLDNTIKEFSNFYANFKDDFPTGSDSRDYQELLRKSFPIHPTLFDFLYEKWGSLEGFQRTRGVLNFVGEVIHHLWNSDENSSMVMPGSVYLNESEIQDELVKYIGVNWSSIISADIDGSNATSYKIDKDDTRLGKYSTTKRVARSIFLGTAPLQGRGLDMKDIIRSSIQPGETLIPFKDAISQLSSKGTYIHGDNVNFWFSNEPSINSLAKSISEQFTPEIIKSHIDEKIKKNIKTFHSNSKFFEGRIHFNPENSDEIIDENDGCRLVVLGTKNTHTLNDQNSEAINFIKNITNYKGNDLRKFKNTLIFLTLDEARLKNLILTSRDLLGWEQVENNREEYNISPIDMKRVKTKIENEILKFDTLLNNALRHIVYPIKQDFTSDTEFKELTISAQQDLIVNIEKKLQTQNIIYPQIGPETLNIILKKYFWNNDIKIKMIDLWNSHCEYLYMPRLVDQNTLTSCVRKSVSELHPGPFAYADNYIDDKKYDNFLIDQSYNAEIKIDENSLIIEKETAEEIRHSIGNTHKKTDKKTDEKTNGTTDGPIEEKPKVFTGNIDLNGSNFSRTANEIYIHIIEVLNSSLNRKIDISIDIRAEDPDGFDKNTERFLKENATNLKFKNYNIE